MNNNVGFISLGCAKALVDSEVIITQLKIAGYNIVSSTNDADIVIVNTCGFIDSAIEESLNTINETINSNHKVIVTGCLTKDIALIKAKCPNVLAINEHFNVKELIGLIQLHLPITADQFESLLLPMPNIGIKLTPKHYAYLKISEGCNNSCTFCIIPSLRGKLESNSFENIINNARNLAKAGYKELLLIAQDLSAYGSDLKEKHNLYDLCVALNELKLWVRLHYVYPYPTVDKIIPLMNDGFVLPYLDMPLQHASEPILRAMKRPANVANILNRIASWRNICHDISIRSTFIVGFPGETEKDFQILIDFLNEAQLDRVGCFKYSEVEGAVANKLGNFVSKELKEERYHILMETQAKISANKLKNKIGSTLDVIIDKVQDNNAVARTKYDAPEIDGVVHLKNAFGLRAGDIIKANIENSDIYDLYGIPIQSLKNTPKNIKIYTPKR